MYAIRSYYELLEGDARLDDAFGGHARLGHAEVEGHVGARLGEALSYNFV